METESLYRENVHHGHNIRHIRKSKGMKQEDLASQVGMTQQNLSKIELRETLDDVVLARFAKVLDVPIDLLKNLEEVAPSFYIENNTIENDGNGAINFGAKDLTSAITNNDPIEKITKLYEDKIALYVSLLKEEKEKNSLLARELSELRKKMSDN